MQLGNGFFLLILFTAARHGFIFQDHEKSSGNSFFQADPSNQIIVVHQKDLTLFIFLLCDIILYFLQMASNIRFFRYDLDLHFHWTDFQIRHIGIDDISLFPCTPQQKIDRLNLHYLDISLILQIADTIFNLLYWEKICFCRLSLFSFFTNRHSFFLIKLLWQITNIREQMLILSFFL